MFENLIECDKNRRQTKKWKYFLVTSIVWVSALAASIAAGIFLYDARLDAQLSVITMLQPLPPAPPPPLGTNGSTTAVSNASPGTRVVQISAVPLREAPPMPAELPATLVQSSFGTGAGPDLGGATGDPNGAVGGSWNGVPNGVNGGTGSMPPPPPPQPQDPPVEKPATPKMIIKSEGVIRCNAIVREKPDYPAIAKAAHVEGEVQVEITIGEDGGVVNARVVNGHPMLRVAALNAAKQWRFNPTLLNNSPVKVQG